MAARIEEPDAKRPRHANAAFIRCTHSKANENLLNSLIKRRADQLTGAEGAGERRISLSLGLSNIRPLAAAMSIIAE
jgi:hypothetical protein